MLKWIQLDTSQKKRRKTSRGGSERNAPSLRPRVGRTSQKERRSFLKSEMMPGSLLTPPRLRQRASRETPPFGVRSLYECQATRVFTETLRSCVAFLGHLDGEINLLLNHSKAS